MHKATQFFLLMIGSLLLVGLVLWRGGGETAVILAEDAQEAAHLPAVFKPEDTPTPEPTNTPEPTPEVTPSVTPEVTPEPVRLRNPSFEDDWETIEFGNQRPKKWAISWVQPGDPLYDSGDLATGICECVHKLDWQLPPNEQPGGPDALILSGTAVYKLFNLSQSWGTTLSQSIELPPGSEWQLSVPIQLHHNGDTDVYGAESSVWVNNLGGWANIDGMGDRHWCKHTRVFEVPENGEVQIDIRFKSKWQKVKNFFIDDLQLVPAGEPAPHSDIDECVLTAPLDTYRPYQE
jgi:hypothetical protein